MIDKYAIDIQAAIDTQLKQFYANIARERDNQLKVRTWSITIWLALITLLSSDKLSINISTSVFILVFTNIIFWAIEGLHHSMVLIDGKKVRKLEELLTKDKLPNNIPLTFFYSNAYDILSRREKIKTFVTACLFSETVVLYYLIMIFISVIFMLFLGH